MTTCHALSDGHFSNWVRQIIAHPCTLIVFTRLPVRSPNSHRLQRFETNCISLFHAGYRLDRSNSGLRLALLNNLGGCLIHGLVAYHYLSKYSLRVWCKPNFFTALYRSGASVMMNCRFQACLIFTITSQAASDRSATTANEKKQSGKCRQPDFA